MTAPALVNVTLDDPKAERVRRSHAPAILTLQEGAFADAVIVQNVIMPNAVTVYVTHSLGRIPKWVGVSALRGASSAGFVVQSATGVDATKIVTLQANGYGATVSVDLVVT